MSKAYLCHSVLLFLFVCLIFDIGGWIQDLPIELHLQALSCV